MTTTIGKPQHDPSDYVAFPFEFLQQVNEAIVKGAQSQRRGGLEKSPLFDRCE